MNEPWEERFDFNDMMINQQAARKYAETLMDADWKLSSDLKNFADCYLVLLAEVERLRKELKDSESDVDTIASHNVELQTQDIELYAHIDRLRVALEISYDFLLPAYGKVLDIKAPLNKIHEALESTPTQSLIEHDKEVRKSALLEAVEICKPYNSVIAGFIQNLAEK